MSLSLKRKEEHNREIVPLKVEESLSLQTLSREEPFLWNRNQKFREKQGNGEKLLQWELSIYRGKGGSFKKTSRFDLCEVSEGRVSTPTFRGWHFLLEFESFCGNGSSESTCFPEGLVLGNSAKHLHPRRVGFVEVHEISFRVMCKDNSQVWFSSRESTVYFRKIEICRNLKSWTYEDPKSWTCEDLESRTWEERGSRTCEDQKSRACEDQKSRACEDQESRTCETPDSQISESMYTDPWNLGVRDKSSEIREKPSQRRYLKSLEWRVN
jgi:hypothetical protein